MTIRKNFLFDEEVAMHLEEIAKVEGKTQTQLVQEAVEDRYKIIKQKKKLEALAKLAGSLVLNEVDDDTNSKRAKYRAK